MLDTILNFDKNLFFIINNGWTNPLSDILFAALTLLGSDYVIIPLIALIFYFFDRKNFKRNFTLLISSLLIGGILVHILKELVDRPRPLGGMEELIKEGKVSINVIFEPLLAASFPSGHSQTIFTAATVLGYIYKRYIGIFYKYRLDIFIDFLIIRVHTDSYQFSVNKHKYLVPAIPTANFF